MIDERLNSDGQRQATEWVRSLPEETPGMAWRAALNERVRAEAERRARRRWRLTLALPGLGFAAAAALSLLVLLPRSPSAAPRPTSRVEASLVALHDQSVERADIVGSGLNPDEAPVSSALATNPLDDLDAGVL